MTFFSLKTQLLCTFSMVKLTNCSRKFFISGYILNTNTFLLDVLYCTCLLLFFSRLDWILHTLQITYGSIFSIKLTSISLSHTPYTDTDTGLAGVPGRPKGWAARLTPNSIYSLKFHCMVKKVALSLQSIRSRMNQSGYYFKNEALMFLFCCSILVYVKKRQVCWTN